MYHPFVIKLPKIENNLDLNSTEKIIYSSVVPYPLFTLGFHSFIHRTRSALGITKNLETKTNFYYVVNPFEPNILNYDDDISKLSKAYLKIKEENPIDFYKIWETLFVFDIASNNNLSICIVSNEDTSSIIENSIKFYREKIISSKKINDTFTSSEKDINKLKKNSCELMILNSKVVSEDDNFIEQNNFASLFSEIIKILKYQKEGGNAVLEFYDSFTIITLKMIYILSSFYEETFVYKPFSSRNSDVDRYLILKNFKSNKKIDNIISTFESVLKMMDTNKYVADIFPELVITKEFMGLFRFINIKLVNNQQIMINDIIKYIKENNYFGDKYHSYRDKQIESTQWWVNNFYPPSVSIYNKNKEDLTKLYKNIQEKLNLECQKFLEISVPSSS
jgi:hypothetical protein